MICTLIVTLAAIGWSTMAFAAGPHDADCMDCHSPHYAKGNFIFGATPNTVLENPASSRTSPSVQGVDALCLGCHNDDQGIMPIHLSTTHPTGVTPSYVTVPTQLLNNGQLVCISCHNPHPANSNYKYLVVDTNNGSQMGKFCVVCHSEQSDPEMVNQTPEIVLNLGPRAEPRVLVNN